MKFRKIGSIATAAVLAGTMGLMPVTALATTVDSTTTVGASNVLNKSWAVASTSQYDANQTFSFTVKYTEAEQVGTWTPKVTYKGTDAVKNTTTSNATVGGTSSTWSGSDTSYRTSLTAAQLLSGWDFKAPGVYKFDVSENNTSNTNVVTDTSHKTVTVVVTMPKDYPTNEIPVIESVGVATTGTDGKTSKTTADFNNTAKANSSLTVKKNVSGTAANKDDFFPFKLTVTNATGNYSVTTPDGNSHTLTAGQDYTFKLKNDQQIVVNNLPQGATYTVSETDQKGYDSTDATVTGESTDKNITDAKTPTATEVTGTIYETSGDTVAYTNKKGFATNTGITMNTLGYGAAAAVVVVAGGALIVSRRRHAGEDF